MTSSDALRPPAPAEPRAHLAKDWLHLNVFDHSTGITGLVNASLHGAPGDPRALAAGSALFWEPGHGWTGDARAVPITEASIGPASVAFDWLGIAVAERTGSVAASVRLPGELGLTLSADPVSTPVEVDARTPFGSGWVSWYIVPRLAVSGWLRLGAGGPLDLGQASAYHDHNWGRWRWGEDIGWEWGVCHAPGPGRWAGSGHGSGSKPGHAPVHARGGGAVLEWTRATDRAHRSGKPSLMVLTEGRRHVYRGRSLTVSRSGRLGPPSPRLPGALAALHSDRRRPSLPRRMRVEMDNGVDWLDLGVSFGGATQLIVPEHSRPGVTFIHELAGTFTCAGRIGGSALEVAGLAMFEHVD